MPLVCFVQTVSIPAPFTGHTQKKHNVVSVTQPCMLLCVMMIRAEGVFKKRNSRKSKCVLHTHREREREGRDLRTEKMRCVI